DSRAVLHDVYRMRIHSATLSVPIDLEDAMRNGRTDDFGRLTETYYRGFGLVPAPADVDPAMRNLTDVDDATALGTLKTLKGSDQTSELILQTGNDLEDRARAA